MTNNWWSSVVAMNVAVASMPATASWLSGTELQQHCDSYVSDSTSRDGALCVAFIQGFIAGTNATEQELAALLEPMGPTTDESFAERAARTRMGSHLRRFAVSNYSRYCVNSEAAAATVVERVTEDLQQEGDHLSDDDKSAEQLVHEALLRIYPCDRE